MTEVTLWSIDTFPEQAQQVFSHVAASQSQEGVLMCLREGDHVNPIACESYDLTTMDWNSQLHGWLFSPQEELKWRCLDNRQIRFVYLGENPELPTGAKTGKQHIKGLREEEGQLIAWGLFDEAGYQEDQTGQHFHYPHMGKLAAGTPSTQQRLAFFIIKYLCPHTGTLKFWRHKQLAWAKSD